MDKDGTSGPRRRLQGRARGGIASLAKRARLPERPVLFVVEDGALEHFVVAAHLGRAEVLEGVARIRVRISLRVHDRIALDRLPNGKNHRFSADPVHAVCEVEGRLFRDARARTVHVQAFPRTASVSSVSSASWRRPDVTLHETAQGSEPNELVPKAGEARVEAARIRNHENGRSGEG